MRTPKMLLCACAVGLCVVAGCGKKSGGTGSGTAGQEAKALELVKTSLPALGLTMDAPRGAEVTGDVATFVRYEPGFGLSVQKDIFGASGDTLITPFEKKLLEQKLVDEPELQIWTKKMAGQAVVLFAMVVEAGGQKYYVQSDGMGQFTRAQVDVMVQAARTLAPQ
jgi:hypothetical protein